MSRVLHACFLAGPLDSSIVSAGSRSTTEEGLGDQSLRMAGGPNCLRMRDGAHEFSHLGPSIRRHGVASEAPDAGAKAQQAFDIDGVQIVRRILSGDEFCNVVDAVSWVETEPERAVAIAVASTSVFCILEKDSRTLKSY